MKHWPGKDNVADVLTKGVAQHFLLSAAICDSQLTRAAKLRKLGLGIPVDEGQLLVDATGEQEGVLLVSLHPSPA